MRKTNGEETVRERLENNLADLAQASMRSERIRLRVERAAAYLSPEAGAALLSEAGDLGRDILRVSDRLGAEWRAWQAAAGYRSHD